MLELGLPAWDSQTWQFNISRFRNIPFRGRHQVGEIGGQLGYHLKWLQVMIVQFVSARPDERTLRTCDRQGLRMRTLTRSTVTRRVTVGRRIGCPVCGLKPRPIRGLRRALSQSLPEPARGRKYANDFPYSLANRCRSIGSNRRSPSSHLVT